ncbi:hypothetical protein PsorP6_017950 [Peronosclerospora sorghi]|uniref:Uncharacterized protein n=1 Tax=Peronosclerospora sorghi TaxID=230839 RepID=A0ACC0WBS9_9STRA|nr:hypothetical protein PsorP6_017950 [Peronosclerospora sorghi]
MYGQELRPKREFVSLLQQLKDCVGISARRAFAQQVTPSELLQRPQSELRKLFPELCAFVDSLVEIRTTHSTSASPTSSLLIRRAFAQPDAHWLSRSARQSGICALLCQQLVRLARQDKSGRTHGSAAALTIQLFLDALLVPCARRLGEAPDACIWRPLEPKPRFHAMTCFHVWSAVLPFAAIMAIQYPHVWQQVLQTYSYDARTPRVNCEFAQISGMWRLVNELNEGDRDNQEAVTHVMASFVRLSSDKLLNGSNFSHLDDQLWAKFFQGMHDFSFNCGRAHRVLQHALLGALKPALTHFNQTNACVRNHVGIFTLAACLYVKDLARDLVAMLLHEIHQAGREEMRVLLLFLVGFCAHVEIVPFVSLLDVLELLVAFYQKESEHAGPRDTRRLEYVFFIVYVALHRRQAVDAVRRDVHRSDAVDAMERLTHFQLHFCTHVRYDDLYLAAPVPWMAKVWHHWIFLAEHEVQAFVSEARARSDAVDQKQVASWQALIEQLACRSVSFSHFRRMQAVVQSHMIASIPLLDDNKCIERVQKRQKTRKRSRMDPERLERSFAVLLQPDVMERVCSFMSAKRLCRMALVCRTFAEICQRASLWRPLYLRLGQSRKAVRLLTVQCNHGIQFAHAWRQLYRKRWKAVRKVRELHRRVAKQQADGQRSDPDARFLPRICSCCGCDKVLKTAREQEVHLAKHERYTCPESLCRASFTGLQQFTQHRKKHAAKT